MVVYLVNAWLISALGRRDAMAAFGLIIALGVVPAVEVTSAAGAAAAP
jgi:hypothetical protein